MSSSENSSSHRRHKKKHRHSHRRSRRRSPSRESSRLASLFDSMHKEMTANHTLFREELGRISSRVAVMEGQSPFVQTGSGPEQSLHSTPSNAHTEEQSLPTVTTQVERQSPLDDRVRADGAEPHTEDTSAYERPVTQTRDWGEDEDEDEAIDYDQQVYWQPEDSDSADNDKKRISPTTAKIVQDAFSRPLEPRKKKNIKRKYPVPDTPFTKVPKLDLTIQSRMTPAAKTADKNLAGMQGLILDAAIPLVNMLESARAGTLNPKDAAESAQQALKLIGNASAHFSTERRRKASTCLNRELTSLVDDPETFKDAAPFLFGSSFQQKMKDHIEAIRNLKQSSSASYGQRQSFRRGHPSQSRGGGNSRGRGYKKPSKTGKP